jgi:hypothetical protein
MTLEEALVVISENGKYVLTDGFERWAIGSLLKAIDQDGVYRVVGDSVHSVSGDKYVDMVPQYSVATSSEGQRLLANDKQGVKKACESLARMLDIGEDDLDRLYVEFTSSIASMILEYAIKIDAIDATDDEAIRALFADRSYSISNLERCWNYEVDQAHARHCIDIDRLSEN